ncbi:MAG: hypothetical protein ABJV68_27890 [Paracoccaceae bacterium]
MSIEFVVLTAGIIGMSVMTAGVISAAVEFSAAKTNRCLAIAGNLAIEENSISVRNANNQNSAVVGVGLNNFSEFCSPTNGSLL